MWANHANVGRGSFWRAVHPESPLWQTYTWSPSAGWSSPTHQVNNHYHCSSIFPVVCSVICRYNVFFFIFAVVNQMQTLLGSFTHSHKTDWRGPKYTIYFTLMQFFWWTTFNYCLSSHKEFPSSLFLLIYPLLSNKKCFFIDVHSFHILPLNIFSIARQEMMSWMILNRKTKGG